MRKSAAIGMSWVLACVAPLALAAPGEYWEMTNKMEMQGMSMPGMTVKVCVPKGGEKDPRNSTDKDCEVTDVKNSGNRTSWKIRCNKNGEVMTGSGDMSATPDRTEGTMTFNSAKTGAMSMSFVNKRVGGACDSDEMKKKAEAQLGAIKQEQTKMCDAAKTGRDWYQLSAMVLNKGAPCGDRKEQFCEVMRRDSGRDLDLYFLLKRDSATIGRECGFGMDGARKALCKSVDAGNADFTRQLRSGMGEMYRQQLRAECPAEMKLYAEAARKRYCEGRGFTEKQRQSLADCLKGASADDDQATQSPDPEEPPMPATPAKKAAAQSAPQPAAQPDAGNTAKPQNGIAIPGLPGSNVSPDAVIDGAKKLKSLFGF